MKVSPDVISKIKLSTDGFPDTTVPQSVRSTPAFSAAFIKAAYGQGNGYWGGKGWDKTYRSKFDLLRMYAVGKQPEESYTDRYSLAKGDSSRSGDGGLLLTSDPSILAVMPQMLTKVLAEIVKYPTLPQVRAGDPKSRTERQDAYYGKLAEINKREEFTQAYGAMGVVAPQDGPQTREELNIFMDAGGYKEAVCVMFESVLMSAFEQVNFDERVREEVVRLDLIPTGMGAVSVNMEDTGVQRIERVAPEDLLLPWSDKLDFHDINWIGKFRRMTNDEIAKEGGSQISRAERDEIKQKFVRSAGTNGWPILGELNGNFQFDYRTPGEVVVLDFYFIAARDVNYKVTEKEGNKSYYKISDDKLLDDDDAPEGVSKDTMSGLSIYGGSWVVGSDIFWNIGLQDHQPMIAPGKPYLPIQVVMPKNYGMNYISLVEICAPTLDRLQLSYLRLQNIEDQNGPSIIAYIREVLAYAAAGGKQTVEDLFREMRAKGTLGIDMPEGFFQALGGSGSPVFKLDINDQRGPIETELMIFAHHMGLLMRNLGFNDITAGGPVDERKGKAVAEMEARSTVIALSDIVKATVRLGTNISRPILGYAISAICDKKKSHYWNCVVGDATVEAIRQLAKDKYAEDGNALVLESIGVGILPYPDQAEVKLINDRIDISLMGHDAQAPLLNLSDAMTLQRYLASGRIKMAESYLLQCEKRRDRKIQEASTQAAKQQSEIQQQLAAMNAQSQQQLLDMKTKADAGKIQMTAQSKMQQDAQTAQLALNQQQAAFINQGQMVELQGSVNAMLDRLSAVLEQSQSDKDAAHEREAIRLQAQEDRETQKVIAQNRPAPKA